MLAWQEASDHCPELGSCASSKRVAALGGSETPSGLRPKVALGVNLSSPPPPTSPIPIPLAACRQEGADAPAARGLHEDVQGVLQAAVARDAGRVLEFDSEVLLNRGHQGLASAVLGQSTVRQDSRCGMSVSLLRFPFRLRCLVVTVLPPLVVALEE